jgi:predicted transposase YbfD/YdcC
MNKVHTVSILTKRILKKTLEIQKKFPELYELLDETPLFFSFTEKDITIKDLRQYLISLSMQQKSFEKRIKKIIF